MKQLKAASFLLPLILTVTAQVSPAAPAALNPLPLRRPESGAGSQKDFTKPPFKGMTTAQARHFYGEPDSVGHRGGEELWTYVLNCGKIYDKSFTVFNLYNKMRYRLLTFCNGLITTFRWDPPEKD